MTGRVLVTGASGLIGHAVLPVLTDAGWEVHAVRRRDADLLDPAATTALVERVRPSHLLHLAWCPVDARRTGVDDNERWAGASLHLLRAFAAAGGRRAVVAGTVAELGASRYGAAKKTLRERAFAHAAEAGYALAWARIFFVFGPHERGDRLVPGVIRTLLAGEPAEVSDGRQRHDFVYVDDVASALARLVGSDLEAVVEVGRGETVPVRQVVETIADQLGGREHVRFGARSGDASASSAAADVSLLRDRLGWKPAVTLEEGIDRTIRWLRGR